MDQQLTVLRRYVLIDVDTQKDFLFARGNCCIRNHSGVLAHIRRIMAWVRSYHVPTISTCEVYPNTYNNQHRCISGTEGQKKIKYTLLQNRSTFLVTDSTDIPIDLFHPTDLFHCYQQVILQKRCIDPFDERLIDKLLDRVQAKEFILIGVAAEKAVKATALGFLQRGKNVRVVVDAVGTHNKRDAKLAFRSMEVRGAKLIKTKDLVGTSHLVRASICDCETCRKPRAVTVALKETLR